MTLLLLHSPSPRFQNRITFSLPIQHQNHQQHLLLFSGKRGLDCAKSTPFILSFRTSVPSSGNSLSNIYSNNKDTFSPVLLDVSKYGTFFDSSDMLLMLLVKLIASSDVTSRVAGVTTSLLVPTTTFRQVSFSSTPSNSGRNLTLKKTMDGYHGNSLCVFY